MSAPTAKSKLFICPKSLYHNDSILFAIGAGILEQLTDNNGMHLATLTSFFEAIQSGLFAIYEQKDWSNWILGFNIRLLAVIESVSLYTHVCVFVYNHELN